LSTASVGRKQATSTCLPGFRALCILERTEQLVHSQHRNGASYLTSVLSLSIPKGTDQLFQPGFRASASSKGPSIRPLPVSALPQHRRSDRTTTTSTGDQLRRQKEKQVRSKSMPKHLGLPYPFRGETFASHKVGTNSTLSPTIHIATSQQCCRAVGSTPQDTV
jgi:hypothetical protein